MINRKGFTLVEIIVAGLIITITAGGTFASYLYARQYSNKFRHRAMAMRGAQEIAEYIRYRLADGYRNGVYLDTGTAGSKTYDKDTIAANAPGYDSDLATVLNPDNWQINNLVDNLDISYTVTDVFFDTNAMETLVDPASPPADNRRFKKITVRVTYDNRTVT